MIIFIYGEDSFSGARHLDAMREKFVDKFDPSGMNLSDFSTGKKLEIGPVAQAVQSLGFMSDKRMVIVKGLLSQVTRKPDAKPWVEQLSKTPEETILILFDALDIKKVEKNEIFKQLSKLEGFHKYVFPALSGTALTKWVLDESARLGLKIDNRLAQQVAGLVGSDLWQLFGELQKLQAYAQDQPVTPEMIELFVKANFEDAMFDFVDAVSQRQSTRALKLLDEQRESGSTDFHLFAMLARQVRLLIGARDVLDRNPNATKQDVASELGVHPFVAQKMVSQARGFDMGKLQRLHGMLYRLDRGVKTGGANITVGVDRVVAEMVS